eukprot:235568-Prorocentrum_lima.AAC.1
MVRTFYARNLEQQHPERTTVCRSRQASLDKVNTQFPALVIDDDTTSLNTEELDQVLGSLASFMDLRT